MNGPCLYDCEYKSWSGYCKLTACAKRTISTSNEYGSVWMPTAPKIKKCPFCGNKVAPHLVTHTNEDGFRDRYSVLCDYRDGGRGADGPWYHSPEEAIEAWNTRAK